ncbi:MAG TPA: NADH-quinone oxidoreductase subunit L, partial [Cyclobacteriaceae bacterium]
SAVPDRLSNSLGSLYTSATHKFYIDEIYLMITKGVIFRFISKPIAWFDRHIIDGFMNVLAALTNWISVQIKEFQSGQVQKYALIFISGVLIIVLSFIYASQ